MKKQADSSTRVTMLGDGVVGPLMETVSPYKSLEQSFSYAYNSLSRGHSFPCALLFVSV